MPATSKKQEKFMRAVAHSKDFAKKVGVPQSVGREFSKKEGGEMKEPKGMMQREVAFMKGKGAPKAMIKHEQREMEEKKPLPVAARKPLPTAAQRKAPPITSAVMRKGGVTKKMAAGGLAAGHKSADGVASKGKTRAKQVTMKKGGKC